LCCCSADYSGYSQAADEARNTSIDLSLRLRAFEN